jgi:inner membrane protein
MMARTHIISSAAVAIPLFYAVVPSQEAFIQFLPVVVGSVAFGAILPDIDEPRSKVGHMLAPIAIVVSSLFRHRTVTHSLVIWGALFLITLALWFFTTLPTIALLIAFGVTGGSFLHIIGDLMTTAPVRGALFPVSKKLFWVVPRFARFEVGAPLEYVYLAGFAAILFAFAAYFVGGQAGLSITNLIK